LLTGGLVGLTIGACATMITSAFADAVSYKAELQGSQEVPPTTSQGSGAADLTYDTATKKLTWKVTYSGLSGPATAAHFHGPAEVGKNAGVAVPIAGTASPMDGSATLTDAQAADLTGGKWYVNIHTAANKGGEIRGQVVKK
jgi:CHRD domain